jgi:predicted nucleic acid-binding protein
LDDGKKFGMDLPDLRREAWATHRKPASIRARPLINDLGPGETEVLMLALESDNPLVILDDRLAREVAMHLKIRLTGTLGILLDAKNAGRIDSVKPRINQLQAFGFRLANHTRVAVLKLAGESS